MNIIRNIIRFLFLGLTVTAGADEAVSSESAADGPSAGRNATDFRAEFQCAMGINTKFGRNNEFGPMGGKAVLITPNVVYVPAIRNGSRGYYSMTSESGTEFVSLPNVKPGVISGMYDIETADPVTKEKFVINVDDMPGIGTIFYKPPPDDHIFTDHAKRMPVSSANDAAAENAILSVLIEDIARTPGYTNMCLNMHCADNDMLKVMQNIVCGCAAHPKLKAAVDEMMKDPVAQRYKDRISCAVAPI